MSRDLDVPSPREKADACLACRMPADGEHATGVGIVCPDCWEIALPAATTRLCDRVHGLLENLHPVSTHVVAQAVEAALPDPEDRLRVWLNSASAVLSRTASQGAGP